MPLYTCVYCDHRGNATTGQIDHLIPLSKRGCNCEENKTEACYSCNSEKRNKAPIEYALWLIERRRALPFRASYIDQSGSQKRPTVWYLEQQAINHIEKAHGRQAATLRGRRVFVE